MTDRKIRWDFMVALADTIVDSENPIRMGMTEERIGHAVAISSMLHDHAITPDMAEALCYATDDPAKALALLNQGFPLEYVVAMGGAR